MITLKTFLKEVLVNNKQTIADICRMLTLVIANDNKDPLISDVLGLPLSLVVFV